MIVLDTHALIWFATARVLLSDAALRAIASADRIGVSAITPWEIAVKVAKGKLDLGLPVREWMTLALTVDRRVELLPLDPEIAIRSAELRRTITADPADCIIAATALTLAVPLVTKDGRLRTALPSVTIW